jgi:hypothetical protein
VIAGPRRAQARRSAYDPIAVEKEVVMITTTKKDLKLAVNLTLLTAAVVAVVYVLLTVIIR